MYRPTSRGVDTMEFSGKMTPKDEDKNRESDGKVLNKKKGQKKRTKNNKKVLSLVFPYLPWEDLLTCRLVSKCWNTKASQELSSTEHPMLKFRFSHGSESYLAQFEPDACCNKIVVSRSKSLFKFLECFSKSSSSSSLPNNFLPYNSFGFFGGDWDTVDLRQFWVRYGINVKTLELGFDDCQVRYASMSKFWDILSLNVPNLSHLILDRPHTRWQNLTGPPPHTEIILSALKTIEIEEYQSYKEHAQLIMALLSSAPNLKNFVNFQFSLLDPFIQANKIGLIKNLEVTHPTFMSEHLWNLQKYFTVWKKFLDCGQPLKLKKIVVIPDECFYSNNEKVKAEFTRLLKKILKSSKDTLKELVMYPIPRVLDEGSVPVLSKLKTLKLYEFDLCITGEVGQNILVNGSRLAKVMPNLDTISLVATDHYTQYEHEDGVRQFHPLNPKMKSGGEGVQEYEVTGVFTIDSDSDEEEVEAKSSNPGKDAAFFPPSIKRLKLTLDMMEKTSLYEMKPLLQKLSKLFVNVNSLRVTTFNPTDSLAGILKTVCVGWKQLQSLEVGALVFDVGERIPGKTWKYVRVMRFEVDQGLGQPINLDKLRREYPLSCLKSLQSLDITRTENHWEKHPGYRLLGPENFHISQAVDQ